MTFVTKSSAKVRRRMGISRSLCGLSQIMGLLPEELRCFVYLQKVRHEITNYNDGQITKSDLMENLSAIALKCIDHYGLKPCECVFLEIYFSGIENLIEHVKYTYI